LVGRVAAIGSKLHAEKEKKKEKDGRFGTRDENRTADAMERLSQQSEAKNGKNGKQKKKRWKKKPF